MPIKLHTQPGETNSHKTTYQTRRDEVMLTKLLTLPGETNANKATDPTRKD